MVASNLEAAPRSPQRQHGGGPLVVSTVVGNVSKEPQTSVSDQGKRTAFGGCCDFHIRHMAGIWYPQDLA